MENNFEKSAESPIENIRQLRDEAMKKLGMEYLDRAAEFAQKLKKDHPDYQNYLVYHLLAGSTPLDNTNVKKEDFEGEDSVEKFLESIINQ